MVNKILLMSGGMKSGRCVEAVSMMDCRWLSKDMIVWLFCLVAVVICVKAVA